MRGTRVHDFGLCHNAGIIPAYAGNTNRCRTGLCLPRDHPRVCGEHGELVHVVPTGRGSSPRMRGTRESGMADYIAERIIPAYAGNTWWRTACPCCIWDHPRVCGEHTCSALAVPVARGSSPRMRGTRVQQFASTLQHGIIPAYAGNTRYPPYCPQAVPDHPRVCGEHPRAPIMKFHGAGSSPRMRGTPKTAVFYDGSAGIIPAYAGNTSGYPSARPYARDHPRVCGEHLISCTFPRNASGSSPRMRGTRRFRKASTPNNGIIPAYAGNTNSKQIKPPQYKDHPRVCGEHRRPVCQTIPAVGSSPRMRGTLG